MVPPEWIISDSTPEAIYLMQWLFIGSTPWLVFYESRSNVNIVFREVAENEDLEIISPHSGRIRVAGGKDVSGIVYYRIRCLQCSYGTYKDWRLPLADLPVDEVYCGQTWIVRFDDVNKELRKSGIIGPETAFPE